MCTAVCILLCGHSTCPALTPTKSPYSIKLHDGQQQGRAGTVKPIAQGHIFSVCPTTPSMPVKLNSPVGCKLCVLRRCLCRCASVTHQAICPIKGPQVREGAGTQEQLWLQGLGCQAAFVTFGCTVIHSLLGGPMQEGNSFLRIVH